MDIGANPCSRYKSNTAHQEESGSVDMKKFMESLPYQDRVYTLFAGHVHAHERFVSFIFIIRPFGPSANHCNFYCTNSYSHLK